MWRKLKPLLILLSVALNIAFISVWAVRVLPQQVGLTAKDSAPRGCEDCTLHRELGTTESQRRQMEPQQAAYLETTQALCRRAQDLRAELIDLIAAPALDANAVSAKQDSILAIQRQMQARIVEHLLSEKQVLTTEQQQKLFAMMRQRCGCGKGGECMNPSMRSHSLKP